VEISLKRLVRRKIFQYFALLFGIRFAIHVKHLIVRERLEPIGKGKAGQSFTLIKPKS